MLMFVSDTPVTIYNAPYGLFKSDSDALMIKIKSLNDSGGAEDKVFFCDSGSQLFDVTWTDACFPIIIK